MQRAESATSLLADDDILAESCRPEIIDDMRSASKYEAKIETEEVMSLVTELSVLTSRVEIFLSLFCVSELSSGGGDADEGGKELSSSLSSSST